MAGMAAGRCWAALAANLEHSQILTNSSSFWQRSWKKRCPGLENWALRSEKPWRPCACLRFGTRQTS